MSSAMEYCSPVRGQEVFNWRLPIAWTGLPSLMH